MKQTVQMEKIQANMAPGVITLSGFLGDDLRKLIDILIADEETVTLMGLSHDQIASRMIELRDAGVRGLGDFINVVPHFEVKVDSVRGKLPCPFGDPGVFPKTNTTVKNLKTGKEVTFTDLNIHMILAHGFYQGRGSLFRLDPEFLAEVTEVEKTE
ncbi:MAG: hypothetical protein LWY06_02430 [Firmicutes bacterium]|nr:hypothetical protein [Bacillota bacterium]